MASLIRETFAKCKAEGRNALVGYLTTGFPSIEETVPLVVGLQDGGADVIELSIPFTDPIADGPTVQKSNVIALQNGMTTHKVLDLVKEARSAGVTVPIILMGYYNPILQYGEKKLVQDAKAAGASGFIVVDLPPEYALNFRHQCTQEGLSFVPLVAPSTTDDRLDQLAHIADSFIYVVSRMGVTGATGSLDSHISELVDRVRAHTGSIPLAVGFGISTPEHFKTVGAFADGVVIGSHIINLIGNSPKEKRVSALKEYLIKVRGGPHPIPAASTSSISAGVVSEEDGWDRKFKPKFGEFGGQYVPEAMHNCLLELEKGFEQAVNSTEFWDEFRSYYPYMGRPSSLHLADRLTEQVGGAKIWLKREDLNHTGSHKINNALGQVLLARRLGKTEVIAETGAGQHGVATATVAAKFGLKCTVFMGAEDVRRQSLNVFRMKLLGATVIPVQSGTKTLRDAVNEALRFWVTNLDTTHYIIGSAIGPHPYPTIVRTLQSVIGNETKEQFKALNNGKLPDAVVACVGGGSNSTGMFAPFADDLSVKLLGVEAGGDGLDTKRHSAKLSSGAGTGVLHGVKTYLLQDSDGQVQDTHSVSAGLDYPAAGPELSYWKDTGRADFIAATDAQALIGFRTLTQIEGIIPALESSHAVYGAVELAKTWSKDKDIVICLSGRGDKDVQSVAEVLPVLGPQIGWDLRFEGSL